MDWKKIRERILYKRIYTGISIKDGVKYSKYQKVARIPALKDKRTFYILLCYSIIMFIAWFVAATIYESKAFKEKGTSDVRETPDAGAPEE